MGPSNLGEYGFMIFWTKNCLILWYNRGVLNTPSCHLTYIYDPATNRVKRHFVGAPGTWSLQEAQNTIVCILMNQLEKQIVTFFAMAKICNNSTPHNWKQFCLSTDTFLWMKIDKELLRLHCHPNSAHISNIWQ